MRFGRSAKKLLAILAALSVFAVAIPVTVTYLYSKTPALHNIFVPDVESPVECSVDVCVQKTIVNLLEKPVSPEGFQFLLKRTDNENYLSIVSGSDGLASTILTFSEQDAGKTYSYRLTEVNDARENMVYDTTEHLIDITIKKDNEQKLVPTVMLNGIQTTTRVNVTFTNVATTEILPPDTGDHSHPLLYFSMVLVGIIGFGALLTLKRKHSL